jgi:hypothetical protein
VNAGNFGVTTVRIPKRAKAKVEVEAEKWSGTEPQLKAPSPPLAKCKPKLACLSFLV